ncbi:MAG: hypothetical protein FD189_2520 [Elusimicrobia bacterium]|nr:MAG: hypothetical protein FD154_2457 [Elusimicrobiota bacterium]KAF0152059.1 MAG: hypothetical protein FD189_2520 [Elusimicrobiota bacterium]
MKHLVAIALAMGLASPALAQEKAPDRILELENKIDALSQEMERIKLGEAAAEPRADTPTLGFSPAASKVYHSQQNKVSIGGYGETTYQNFSKRRQDGNAAGRRDEADALRNIIYVGYKFNDKILFNSEIEFEHGTTGNGRGMVSVEAAYIDFRLSRPFGIRAGTLLVPMGITNETHEPTTFHGVLRPSVERNIIPSTWRENGAGVFGEAGILSYRSYIMTGLQAIKDKGVDGFTGSTALRRGRSSAAKSYAEDLAWIGRLDISPLEGVKAGASLYFGKADQSLLARSVPVTLHEVHVQAEYRSLEIKALHAQGTIGNAAGVNSAQGFTDAAKNSVGSKFFGGYVEGALNILAGTQTSQYLAFFARYERYNTQWRTPAGFARDPANSRSEYTGGLTYKPIPQVAVKLDHQRITNRARTGINQFNLGLAYIF